MMSLDEKIFIKKILTEIIEDIYKTSCVGCCMHITLDDNNFTDDNIDFCLRKAMENECHNCFCCASILSRLCKNQRKNIVIKIMGESKL